MVALALLVNNRKSLIEQILDLEKGLRGHYNEKNYKNLNVFLSPFVVDFITK